jgi:hypothetical protein
MVLAVEARQHGIGDLAIDGDGEAALPCIDVGVSSLAGGLRTWRRCAETHRNNQQESKTLHGAAPEFLGDTMMRQAVRLRCPKTMAGGLTARTQNSLIDRISFSRSFAPVRDGPIGPTSASV